MSCEIAGPLSTPSHDQGSSPPSLQAPHTRNYVLLTQQLSSLLAVMAAASKKACRAGLANADASAAGPTRNKAWPGLAGAAADRSVFYNASVADVFGDAGDRSVVPRVSAVRLPLLGIAACREAQLLAAQLAACPRRWCSK